MVSANEPPQPTPPEEHTCLGDWLNNYSDTSNDLIRTAYFARTTDFTARAARALGKDDEALELENLFANIRKAFNKAYVLKDGRLSSDTQTAYALALTFHLLDEATAIQTGDNLVKAIEQCDGCLSTGFIGTHPLMQALAMIGRNDVAYTLLHNDRLPSWNFSIKNGATTIWERWDGWTPEAGFRGAGMNSFNHYSFGVVYQWMVENIGGIQSLDTAYKNILIAPEPGGRLTRAEVSYASVRGRIKSRWQLEEGRMTLEVEIPANTTALVRFPSQHVSSISENSQPAMTVKGVEGHSKSSNGNVQLTLASGQYCFEISNPEL